jgi:mono/diheme cytochrome c family protein
MAAAGPVSGADAVALGKEIYVERCVLCHGTAGHGWDWSQKIMKPPVPVPNLVETLPAMSDETLRRIIVEGGEGVGRTRFMPAFGFSMRPGELDALVSYLRAISGGARTGRR